MSFDERVELFRVAKDAAAGRVPLVAGACSDSTREVACLAQEGEKLGFDAVMALVNLQGRCGGLPRKPILPVTDNAQLEAMQAALVAVVV